MYCANALQYGDHGASTVPMCIEYLEAKYWHYLLSFARATKSIPTTSIPPSSTIFHNLHDGRAKRQPSKGRTQGQPKPNEEEQTQEQQPKEEGQ